MSTKAKTAAAPKAAPAKAKAKTEKAVAAPKGKAEKKEPGKISQIIALHKKGKSNAEIVETGFNKTTVAIQVAAYKKDPAAWEAKHAAKA